MILLNIFLNSEADHKSISNYTTIMCIPFTSNTLVINEIKYFVLSRFPFGDLPNHFWEQFTLNILQYYLSANRQYQWMRCLIPHICIFGRFFI